MRFLTFEEVCQACLAEPKLVAGFERLQNRDLSRRLRRAPVEKAVDVATGYDEVLKARQDEDVKAFIGFVRDIVWLRMPRVVVDGVELLVTA